LIDAKVILELGNYDSLNQFFEMDYAKKWTDAGFKSAFFNKITNRHIGRLTSDRNTKVVKNAYDLNNEDQFNNNKDKDKESRSKSFIKIVNLERRKDRKDNMTDLLKNLNIENEQYEFITAVDGNSLKPTQELYNLFKGNDFGSRKGVIGCALSHYQLWKQLLNDKNHSFYLIMEDDIEFCDDFKNKMENLMPNFVSNEILYLGYHMFKKNRDKVRNIYDISREITNVISLDKTLYIGGTFSYSINKKGAKILIDYIENNGIKHGIDYVMKIIPLLNSFECQPHLTFSEWNENGQNVDSDIQNIYDGLDFTNIKKNLYSENIEEYFVFIPNLDQNGNDLYYHKKSLNELKIIALQDDKCIGFNTLGFFKNKIDRLQSSGYFKEGDGIYIKKSVYEDYLNKKQIDSEINMIDKDCIRIKMLCNWSSSEQVCKEWSYMCETDFKWKNYQIVWTDVKEEIDYYVIINYCSKDAYYDPKRTIVFQMEPWVYDTSKPWGVKTWGKWAEPNPNDFLAVRGRKTECHNNAFWQLGLTLNELQNSKLIEKTKGSTISTICSSKYFY
jgi:GR25 family glycosyltransferase involved in LPS biosynthesis